MKNLIICLCVIVAFCEAEKPVPKYIKTCKRNDPNVGDCFAKHANLAMSHIAKGDKHYDIKTLLPLNFRELLVVDMTPLTLMLLQIEVFGTENMTIVDPVIDFESKQFQFTFTNPLIIWKSKFAAVVEENGISIETNGHAKISFSNGKFAMIYEYDLQERNGKEYANITKFDSDFLSVNVDFQLEHLDDNPVIQQEWERVKKDFIGSQVEVACAEIVGEYINKIFNVVPFNELFTE